MIKYSFFLAIALNLVACGEKEVITSESSVNAEQVRNLEYRATAGDLASMRELQLHYGFEGNREESERWRQRRFELNDPEIMDDKVLDMLSASEKERDPLRKRTILKEALIIAEKAAQINKIKDISTDDTVKMVKEDLAEIDQVKNEK
jgi:hypothetical protein